jgi:hypothetical protein
LLHSAVRCRRATKRASHLVRQRIR